MSFRARKERLAPWKSNPFPPECLKSCSQACSLPSHCSQDPSMVTKPLLGPGGCGGGSWACVVSVLHLGLVSCASDELHSVLEQNSSALLPLCRFCPQSLAGSFWLGGDFSSPTLQVFLQNPKAAFDSLALLACSSNSTQFYKPHKASCACYSDS